MLTGTCTTVMALVGFSASAAQALAYKQGDYIMGSLNKKASGAQCFIMALGVFRNLVTGLYLEHPMASAFLSLGAVAYLGFPRGGNVCWPLVLTQRGANFNCFPNFFYGEKHKMFAKGGMAQCPL